MNSFIKAMPKYLLKVFIVLLIISAAVFGISHYFDFVLSETFTYAAIICFVIGITSVMGRMNVSSDPTYFQSKSISSKSMSQNSLDEFKLRDKNLSFLALMSTVGLLLILICIILTNYQL